MPPATLSSLPVEVHFHILKYVLYSSQSWDDGSSSPDWIEEDRCNLSQFPYNVVAVCQLWHAVLTKIPECWTRVIIDIATDPSRFLDVFLWSKDLRNLEVTILNSHTPESEDVTFSSLERERVSAIVNAIRPHISRCKYIAFDVAFLTSLPSPLVFLLEDRPHLEGLYLDCRIDNTGSPGDYSLLCDLGVSEPIQKGSSFPVLLTLSLTGFWFMFIAGHPHTLEWFKTTMRTGSEYDVQQIVTRFQFQKEGQYTLQNLVSYFSVLETHSIILCHLSLNHNGPILEGGKSDEDAFLYRQSMIFQNVTPDVLQTLFYLADISPDELTFDNCTFPDVALPSASSKLTLSNIPRSAPSMNPAINAQNAPNLGSILKNWLGSSLVVNSCPSFDDDALGDLNGRPTLGYFEVYDSGNFTVHGLQQYFKRRNRHSAETTGTPKYQALERLDVDSINCPFLSEEDKEWFVTNDYASATRISWVRRDPESHAQLQVFYNVDSESYNS